jgi:hypothetical protein
MGLANTEGEYHMTKIAVIGVIAAILGFGWAATAATTQKAARYQNASYQGRTPANFQSNWNVSY